MSRRALPHDGFLFHAVALTALWNRPRARASRSRCQHSGKRAMCQPAIHNWYTIV